MKTTNWYQQGRSQTLYAAIVLAGMMLVIGSALAFEHIGGYAPCALCLEQRGPYYWAMPIMVVGLVSAFMSWHPMITRVLFLIVLALLLHTGVLGIYHSGVEWGYFEAPQSCGAGTSAGSSDAGDLLTSLASAKPPSCAAAAGRFLGLSFAGWNVVAAGLLFIVALRGAFAKPS
jgi:disulfide bond formation protein DsbB